jgi:hypothetical protein
MDVFREHDSIESDISPDIKARVIGPQVPVHDMHDVGFPASISGPNGFDHAPIVGTAGNQKRALVKWCADRIPLYQDSSPGLHIGRMT